MVSISFIEVQNVTFKTFVTKTMKIGFVVVVVVRTAQNRHFFRTNNAPRIKWFHFIFLVTSGKTQSFTIHQQQKVYLIFDTTIFFTVEIFISFHFIFWTQSNCMKKLVCDHGDSIGVHLCVHLILFFSCSSCKVNRFRKMCRLIFLLMHSWTCSFSIKICAI